MKAKEGVQFLTLLLQQGLMDEGDLEEAIRIAGEKSPTGAFSAAQRYFIVKHGSAVLGGYLAFAKGTRWLAMVRRDDGQTAFEEAARDAATTAGFAICPACKKLAVPESLEPCDKCGAIGCQNCLARRSGPGVSQRWHFPSCPPGQPTI